MHVEVMELHDKVMITEYCLRDVVALIALGFGVCFVMLIISLHSTLQIPSPNNKDVCGISIDAFLWSTNDCGNSCKTV
jgi:hypothetical protein